MKNKVGILLCVVMIILSGCVQENIDETTEKQTMETETIETKITKTNSLEETIYIGELTSEGMTFTATDASGNPISGIITVEEQIATVTFTDSTWSLLENGSVYKFSKCSDVTNVWN